MQGLTEETRRLLMNYEWPGNVRELRNAMERAMILEDGPLLKPDDLPFPVASGATRTSFQGTPGMEAGASDGKESAHGVHKRQMPPLFIPKGGTSLEQVEHALVELALKQAQGNQIRAAKLLDISRYALRYKMKKFGIGNADDDELAEPKEA